MRRLSKVGLFKSKQHSSSNNNDEDSSNINNRSGSFFTHRPRSFVSLTSSSPRPQSQVFSSSTTTSVMENESRRHSQYDTYSHSQIFIAHPQDLTSPSFFNSTAASTPNRLSMISNNDTEIYPPTISTLSQEDSITDLTYYSTQSKLAKIPQSASTYTITPNNPVNKFKNKQLEIPSSETANSLHTVPSNATMNTIRGTTGNAASSSSTKNNAKSDLNNELNDISNHANGSPDFMFENQEYIRVIVTPESVIVMDAHSYQKQISKAPPKPSLTSRNDQTTESLASSSSLPIQLMVKDLRNRVAQILESGNDTNSVSDDNGQVENLARFLAVVRYHLLQVQAAQQRQEREKWGRKKHHVDTASADSATTSAISKNNNNFSNKVYDEKFWSFLALQSSKNLVKTRYIESGISKSSDSRSNSKKSADISSLRRRSSISFIRRRRKSKNEDSKDGKLKRKKSRLSWFGFESDDNASDYSSGSDSEYYESEDDSRRPSLYLESIRSNTTSNFNYNHRFPKKSSKNVDNNDNHDQNKQSRLSDQSLRTEAIDMIHTMGYPKDGMQAIYFVTAYEPSFSLNPFGSSSTITALCRLDEAANKSTKNQSFAKPNEASLPIGLLVSVYISPIDMEVYKTKVPSHWIAWTPSKDKEYILTPKSSQRNVAAANISPSNTSIITSQDSINQDMTSIYSNYSSSLDPKSQIVQQKHESNEFKAHRSKAQSINELLLEPDFQFLVNADKLDETLNSPEISPIPSHTKIKTLEQQPAQIETQNNVSTHKHTKSFGLSNVLDFGAGLQTPPDLSGEFESSLSEEAKSVINNANNSNQKNPPTPPTTGTTSEYFGLSLPFENDKGRLLDPNDDSELSKYVNDDRRKRVSKNIQKQDASQSKSRPLNMNFDDEESYQFDLSEFSSYFGGVPPTAAISSAQPVDNSSVPPTVGNSTEPSTDILPTSTLPSQQTDSILSPQPSTQNESKTFDEQLLPNFSSPVSKFDTFASPSKTSNAETLPTDESSKKEDDSTLPDQQNGTVTKSEAVLKEKKPKRRWWMLGKKSSSNKKGSNNSDRISQISNDSTKFTTPTVDNGKFSPMPTPNSNVSNDTTVFEAKSPQIPSGDDVHKADSPLATLNATISAHTNISKNESMTIDNDDTHYKKEGRDSQIKTHSDVSIKSPKATKVVVIEQAQPLHSSPKPIERHASIVASTAESASSNTSTVDEKENQKDYNNKEEIVTNSSVYQNEYVEEKENTQQYDNGSSTYSSGSSRKSLNNEARRNSEGSANVTQEPNIPSTPEPENNNDYVRKINGKPVSPQFVTDNGPAVSADEYYKQYQKELEMQRRKERQEKEKQKRAQLDQIKNIRRNHMKQYIDQQQQQQSNPRGGRHIQQPQPQQQQQQRHTTSHHHQNQPYHQHHMKQQQPGSQKPNNRNQYQRQQQQVYGQQIVRPNSNPPVQSHHHQYKQQHRQSQQQYPLINSIPSPIPNNGQFSMLPGSLPPQQPPMRPYNNTQAHGHNKHSYAQLLE